MEKKNVFLPLFLALISALAIYFWLKGWERSAIGGFEMTEVLTAKLDIPPRTILRKGLIDRAKIPRKFIQQDAIEYRSDMDIKQIENLVTQVRVPKGNQITLSSLLTLNPDVGISLKIPPGYRGVVLPVEADLLQLIKPGDRVDILVTFDALMQEGRKEKVTATILQNILVLGVGTDLGQGRTEEEEKKRKKTELERVQFREKGALSLAMLPNEAQYLSLARQQGDVSVVIRGVGEFNLHPLEMATFRKLFR